MSNRFQDIADHRDVFKGDCVPHFNRVRRFQLLLKIRSVCWILLASAATIPAVHAQCSPNGPTITCTPDPGPGSYSSGISYQNENVTINGLALTLQDGVTISTMAGQDGVSIEQSGNISLTAIGAINITIGATTPVDRDGFRLDSINGAVTINSTANITTSNTEGDGIVARSNLVDNEDPGWNDNTKAHGTGNVSITSSSTIHTSGDKSTGITAGSGGSTVSIINNGDVITEGATDSGAIVAKNYSTSNTSRTEVSLTGADLKTVGAQSAGIAAAANRGLTIINSIGGSITTQGTKAVGIGGATGLTNIYALDSSLIALTPTGAGVTINNGTSAAPGNDGTSIETHGEWAYGVAGLSRGGAINLLNRGTISTEGKAASGIAALHTFVPFSGSTKGGPVGLDNRAAIVTSGDSAGGILAVALSSDINITSSGAISTSGNTVPISELVPLGVTAAAAGIQAAVTQVTQGPFTLGGNGNISISTTNTGTIDTAGTRATGIEATAVRGLVAVDAQGAVTTKGNQSVGILARNTGTGNITVTANSIQTGDIGAGTGEESHGIVAGVNPLAHDIMTSGNVTVTANGPIETAGAGAYGIWAQGEGNGTVTVTADKKITTHGDPSFSSFSLQASGIRADSQDGALTVTAGDIATTGMAATGISVTTQAGEAKITTRAGSLISTEGEGASGINAASTSSPVTIDINGSIETKGENSVGAYASSFDFPIGGNQASINQAQTSTIAVHGKDSVGAWANGANGAKISALGSVTASGEFATGLIASARNGSSAEMTIDSGAVITGGWQTSSTGAGAFAPAAGVLIGAEGGTATLINRGVITAGSDRVIADLSRYAPSPTTIGSIATTITNHGSITGFVELGAGTNRFDNLSMKSFNLRHFADTDGDGRRDTHRVAISDFGGAGSMFNNVGALRLSTVTGATTVDQTGAYIPTNVDASVHNMNLGVSQGHIVNLATFNHSGLITMQNAETGGAGPIAGDVLVITGGASAATPGSGVFISNGGSLHLDTVLNEGGPKSQSDILVVDNTQLGPGGATSLLIANAGGTGAMTVNDGIKIIEVNGTSAAGSFALSGSVQAGAYEYFLHQGGSQSANDWFLRSEFTPPPVDPPVDPPVNPPVDPPVNPPGGNPPTNNPPVNPPAHGPVAYRPATVGYTLGPALAMEYGFLTIGKLHERVGEEETLRWDARDPKLQHGVWTRFIGQGLNLGGSRFVLKNGRAYFSQVGVDLAVLHGDNGERTHIGMFGSYGMFGATHYDNARSTAGLRTMTGDMDTQVAGGGAYVTRYWKSGSYIDIVGQANYYRNRYWDVYNGKGKQTGWGPSLSVEVGRPYSLHDPNWKVEPEAQLVYQHLHLNGFTDNISAIGPSNSNMLRGRLGSRFYTKSEKLGKGFGYFSPYLSAHILHDFFRPAHVLVGSTPVRENLPMTWFEVGGGFNTPLMENVYFYADAKYQRAFNTYRQAVQGVMGIRCNF